MKNLAFTTLALILISCNQNTCNNLNPVFDKYKPDDYNYTNELGNQLLKKGSDNFTYTVAEYSKDTLRINIKDDSICALAALRIIRYDDTANKIKETKGNGYIGAELKGLKIIVLKNCTETSFVYRGADGITD